MKSLANIITCLRFLFAFLIFFVDAFSLSFWILYLCCGFSDFLDGFLARRLHIESELGAKLDSLADTFCILTIIMVLLPMIYLTTWMYFGIASIIFIRAISYVIGFIKYRTFSSLHTYLNKFTGLLLFVAPVICMICGINTTMIILIIVALVSAIEELVITLKSKSLNRNCKSLLSVFSSSN